MELGKKKRGRGMVGNGVGIKEKVIVFGLKDCFEK